MTNPNAIPTRGGRAGSPRSNKSATSARKSPRGGAADDSDSPRNPGTRSKSSKKLEQSATVNVNVGGNGFIRIGALEPGEESKGKASGSTAKDKRRNYSSEARRPATETFHIIEGLKTEKRWELSSHGSEEQKRSEVD